MNFESQRHEISHHVHVAAAPLSAAELFEICELATTREAFSVMLATMCKNGQLRRHAAPEGSGAGTRWLYGPGRVKLGATPPQNDAGGDRTARKVRTVTPHKTLRKTAPKSAGVTPLQSSAARWALTNDGAFLLLDTNTEIPQPAARALVEFVRRLDAGAA